MAGIRHTTTGATRYKHPTPWGSWGLLTALPVDLIGLISYSEAVFAGLLLLSRGSEAVFPYQQILPPCGATFPACLYVSFPVNMKLSLQPSVGNVTPCTSYALITVIVLHWGCLLFRQMASLQFLHQLYNIAVIVHESLIETDS